MLEELNRKIEKVKNDVALKRILNEEALRLENKLKSDEEKLYNLEKEHESLKKEYSLVIEGL